MKKYLPLLSLLCLLVNVQAQEILDNLEVEVTLGSNLTQDAADISITTTDAGSNQFRPNFGLGLVSSIYLKKNYFLSVGAKIDFNNIKIKNERRVDVLNTLVFSPGMSDWFEASPVNPSVRTTDIRYANLEIPISLERKYGNRGQWRSGVGLYATYRLMGSAAFELERTTNVIWVTFVNPNGESQSFPNVVDPPRVSTSQAEDVDLPANRFQYGTKFNTYYSFKQKKGTVWSLGIDVNYFLSDNKIWHSKQLKWRAALTLRASI